MKRLPAKSGKREPVRQKRQEEKTEGDSAAASAEKTDGAHKKKNLAYVIRPQNSREQQQNPGKPPESAGTADVSGRNKTVC